MGKKKRVLIVEDDRIVRDSLKRLLSGGEVEIDGAETAEEGLDKFIRHRHDLILADLRLPGMDGLAMVEKMKRLDRALPFIIFSAYDEAEDVLRAVKLGAVDYCVKPFDAGEILELTQRVTKSSRSRPSHPEPPSGSQGTHSETEMSQSKKADAVAHEGLFSPDLLRFLQLSAPFISIGSQATGITHNLNGPLTGMMGQLELLRMKNPELEKDLDIVLDLTRKLRDQIAELQTKFENETLRQEQIIDINRLVQDELNYLKTDLFYKHYISRGLELDKSLPKIKGVYADFALSVEQVLINAIDAQRQKKDGRIEVKTSVEDGNICIRIDDDGPGFSDDALTNAFEPFWPEIRIDDEGRVRTGLGLYLAKRWLKPYGSEIRIENRSSGGGRVTIIIPQSH
jgi:CheY-like chemotaxis protein/anti-sigma regulatory factor (Ser/Thr protein kinase)